ncbi:MAG: flagellum-specific ATP synthase FliI, partial [Hyphomonas sp.]
MSRLGEPARAIQRAGVLRLPMGEGLLGRVVDAQGLPLDHGGPVQDVVSEPMG